MNTTVFESFPEIRTERLLLRQLRPKDINEVAELMFNNNDKTPLELINQLEYNFNEQTAINWGFEYNGEIIGTCGYYRGFKNNTGEIGFVMRESFRKKGFMLEAANRITQFGFEQLQLDKITALTTPENTATINLMGKLNYLPSVQKHEKYLVFELSSKMQNTELF